MTLTSTETSNNNSYFAAAISEPKLSVVPSVHGGFTLQCEAKCWLPEPEITFLNDLGKDIGGEYQMSAQEASGCFTVTKTVAVKTQTNRFHFSLILHFATAVDSTRAPKIFILYIFCCTEVNETKT